MKNAEQTSHFRTLTEYNGYTNKPTWLVGVWIDNDQQQLNSVLRLAIDAIELEDDPVYWLANALEMEHEDAKDELNAGILNDLLSFTLCYVNWMELAEGYIEQAKEQLEMEEL